MRWWVLSALVSTLGALVVLRGYVSRRGRRDRALIAAQIKPVVYHFTGLDDALRQRTAKKRAAADGIRGRASKVETGAPVSELLRVVHGQKR